MLVNGNNISIHRGESFTIDKYFVNKDGSPYVISNRLKNPYILISVSTNVYGTSNKYNYNEWCDVSNFYRFASTIVYHINDVGGELPTSPGLLEYSVGHITNLSGVTTYYCDDTVFECLGNYYVFVFSSNPEVTSDYSGSFVKYELRFIANFDSEITRTWSSQQYKYSISLVSGETTHDALTQIYASQVGFDNILTGVVTEAGDVVPDIQVFVYKGSDTTGKLLAMVTTNSDGRYTYKIQESGYYTLLVGDISETLYIKYDPFNEVTTTKNFDIEPVNTLYVRAKSDDNNTIYLSPALYSNRINWGDGIITNAASFSVDYWSAAISHEYAASGDYTISVYGSFNLTGWSYSSYTSHWVNVMAMNDYASQLSSYNDTLISAKITTETALGQDGYFSIFTFEDCIALEQIELANCTKLAYRAFHNCSSLESIIATKCSIAGGCVFENCVSLSDVKMSILAETGASDFNNCAVLSSVVFPELRDIGDECFANCSSLEYISVPKVETAYYGAFISCTALSYISLPNLSGATPADMFLSCSNLQVVYFGSKLSSLDTMNSPPFVYCPNIHTLYLMHGSVVQNTAHALWWTDITSSTGSIYVPASLVSDYQVDALWSEYSTQFIGV